MIFLELITVLVLVVFLLEAFHIYKLRVLLHPRFLLALWRVYVVFPIARRRPCSVPQCQRQRAEYRGKVWCWCEHHAPWNDDGYVRSLQADNSGDLLSLGG